MAEYLSPGVFVEELSSGIKPIEGVGTSVGAFVGHAEKGPVGKAVAINNFGSFLRTFGGFTPLGFLAYAVRAFFDEGGTSCYVVRTCQHDVAGKPLAVASKKEFANASASDTVTISASSPGSWGDDLSITIEHAAGAPADEFTIVVLESGSQRETIEAVSILPASSRYVVSAVENESAAIRVTDLGLASRPATATAVPLTGGTDALDSALSPGDYVGVDGSRIGLHAFDEVDAINIVAVPETVDRDVHVGGMAYCENRGDCFYVADSEQGIETADDVLNYKLAQGSFAGGNALNSKYGALYTPWIEVSDQLTGGRKTIPPSGAVAGRYAGTDATRGVHKAAAGTTDGRMASVLDVDVRFIAADQEKLNPKGINVIRRFEGVGNVIWGARTVSSDSEWRYVNVRRLFLFLEESIEEATTWVVFEPNGPDLWKSLVRNVSAFLRLQWRDGALVGATEEQAFYVKCDEETNPQEVIDAGQVITEIGVAPSKPAEFVIFRIRQFVASEAS